MRDLSKLLWGDLQTDRERLVFIESGRAVDTGILAPAMVEDLAGVYRRIDEAVSRSQQAIRFGLTREGDIFCGFARDIVDVVEILRGNAPTDWAQGVACQDKGEKLRVQHEKTIESLRKRIDAAVKALQGMTWHEVEPYDQFGIVDERNEHGEWVQWDDIEDVVEILKGNSPTISEGSD